MRRLAGYTAVILATLAVLLLVWQFRAVFVLFVLSLLATAAVRPLIVRLVRAGMPLTLAMLLTYISGLGLVILLLYAFSGILMLEIESIVGELARSYETARPQWLQGSAFQQAVAARLPAPQQLYEAVTGREGELFWQTLFGVTLGVISIIAGIIMMLVMSVYWSADQDHFERLWLSLLPAAQRARARNIWRTIETEVGAYIRSEAVQSFMAGMLLGLGYWAMGLEYPVLLALAGAIIWLIPLVGSVLIAVPVFLVGLSSNLLLAVVATLYTLLVLSIMEFVLEPRLYNRRRISAILILLTMIPLADAFGLVGLIVAPPLAAAIQISFSHIFNYESPPVSPQAADQVAGLRERLIQVRTIFEETEEPPPEVVNLIERLSRLLQKAEEILPKEQSGETARQSGIR